MNTIVRYIYAFAIVILWKLALSTIKLFPHLPRFAYNKRVYGEDNIWEDPG